MKIQLLFLIFTCTTTLFAQNKGKVQGIVYSADSSALEKATVSIIDPQDSSVLSYSLTDVEGKFNFVRLPQHKTLILFISHININSFHKPFTIDETATINFGTIRLEGKTLDEVVVTAIPIRMNQDTLEYNAAYFKVHANANVEELLKKLPGLQVNIDGTIYYEGKEVSDIKVDGKDFFSSDTRIATRNLDANLVKSVQVYRDKGESKKTVDDEENLPITINLKFKNEFLRTDFGKAYASGGSRERYESGALFNTFRDTMQISFIAYGNNINRESFDYNELHQHAGLGRAENHGFGDFGGRSYGGIGNDMGGGINFNNDWGKNPKLKNTKLNIMYLYQYNKRKSSNDGSSTFKLNDQQQYSNYAYNSLDKSNKHRVQSLFRHRFDSTAYVEFKPKVQFEHNDNQSGYNTDSKNDTNLLGKNKTENTDKNSKTSYSHNFYAEKQLSKDHLLSLSNTLDLNNTESNTLSDHHVEMYQTTEPNTFIWDNTIQNTHANSIYTSAAYHNTVLKKLTFDLYFTLGIGSHRPTESFYYDRNKSGIIHGPQYENDYTFLYKDYISGIRFSWKPIKKMTVNFGTAYQIKNTKFDFVAIHTQKEKNKDYWLPNITIRYEGLNFGWSQNVQNPEIQGIQTQVNDLNPLYKQLPSLDFENALVQETFVGYTRYKAKYQVGGRVSITDKNNNLGNKLWRDMNTGYSITQRYQAGESRSFNGHIFFMYNFKKGKDWQYRTSTVPHIYTYQNYQTINDIENRETGRVLTINQEFSIRWKELIGITPKYTFSMRTNSNSVKDNSDFQERSFPTHTFGFGLNINPIKGFSLEMTYSLQNTASGIDTRANYNIINSSLYYSLKNKSQFKLSAFDLLNQNVQNYWGTGSNSTYYTNFLMLRQYFLLGYIYKFNFTKTK